MGENGGGHVHQRLRQAKTAHQLARRSLSLARRAGEYEAQVYYEHLLKRARKRLSSARKTYDRTKNKGRL